MFGITIIDGAQEKDGGHKTKLKIPTVWKFERQRNKSHYIVIPNKERVSEWIDNEFILEIVVAVEVAVAVAIALLCTVVQTNMSSAPLHWLLSGRPTMGKLVWVARHGALQGVLPLAGASSKHPNPTPQGYLFVGSNEKVPLGVRNYWTMQFDNNKCCLNPLMYPICYLPPEQVPRNWHPDLSVTIAPLLSGRHNTIFKRWAQSSPNSTCIAWSELRWLKTHLTSFHSICPPFWSISSSLQPPKHWFVKQLCPKITNQKLMLSHPATPTAASDGTWVTSSIMR